MVIRGGVKKLGCAIRKGMRTPDWVRKKFFVPPPLPTYDRTLFIADDCVRVSLMQLLTGKLTQKSIGILNFKNL